MELKFIIDEELKRRGKSFKWLVAAVGISNDGLKAGIENETIKLKDFKKLCKVLELPVQLPFDPSNSNQQRPYDHQQLQASLVNEAEQEYVKKEIAGLQKQVELLESQLEDKNKIIELLSRKER
jgi:DNA-binding Xre family transcriptional regulator